jgi:putative SOS response-associated peptidase YedK
MRWGLIPSWAKDAKIGNSLINARAETIAEKPSFRTAFKRRRCLVIADVFYKWSKFEKVKIPFLITLRSRSTFAFADLWEQWKEPTGDWIESTTIITTNPNSLMASIHDRMPVTRSANRILRQQSIVRSFYFVVWLRRCAAT